MTNPIRNFCIIAHIDHGKSTLADRILQHSKAIDTRNIQAQMLDTLDIERERGITIKAQTATFDYNYNGVEYTLNLIDTPGHVDFTYEVSRSLAACEGALLIVDASQGVEAQTVANTYLALDSGVKVVPILNKIDLPHSDVDSTCLQIEEELGISTVDIACCSAKSGIGIEEVFKRIIEEIPAPEIHLDKPLRALIFDSWFDIYQGVIILVRVMDGSVKAGDKIEIFHSGSVYEVQKVGKTCLQFYPMDSLSSGEVGYIIANIKNIAETQVGDTLFHHGDREKIAALEGFKPVKQMVYAGVFPMENSDFNHLRDSLQKLALNDSSLSFTPETSQALGVGFRCGFLGFLHMEIVQERLEREYNLQLIFTAPSCSYRLKLTQGTEIEIQNPAEFPDSSSIEALFEPVTRAVFHLPETYVGALLQFLSERRGEQKDIKYLNHHRVQLTYEIPLNEIIFDFFDKIKSLSRGYVTLDYEIIGYQQSDLIKLDILINSKPLDALSVILHRSQAYYRGKALVKKLQSVIPRQQFEVALQAAVQNKVISRETIKPVRKDVIAKCYGGDISRKRKLLEKQKEGKKRMKVVGMVEIPQEAFMSVLSIDDE